MTIEQRKIQHVRSRYRSSSPLLFDAANSLKKLADLAASAAGQKAELVVFP